MVQEKGNEIGSFLFLFKAFGLFDLKICALVIVIITNLGWECADTCNFGD